MDQNNGSKFLPCPVAKISVNASGFSKFSSGLLRFKSIFSLIKFRLFSLVIILDRWLVGAQFIQFCLHFFTLKKLKNRENLKCGQLGFWDLESILLLKKMQELFHWTDQKLRDPRTAWSEDRSVRLGPRFSKFFWSWCGSVRDFLIFFWSWSGTDRFRSVDPCKSS